MPYETTGVGGVRNFYGPRGNPTTNPEPFAGKEQTYGNTTEIELNFTFDNLPPQSATDALVFTIPANSFIVSARLFTPTAWVGGTSIAVDSRVPSTGAVVTANGFVTATQGATANLTANSWITGTGGLIGATVGTADVQLGITVVGTYTAGRSRLLIEYYRPQG